MRNGDEDEPKCRTETEMFETIGIITVASLGTTATLAWVRSLEHECTECEQSTGRNPPNYCPECGEELGSPDGENEGDMDEEGDDDGEDEDRAGDGEDTDDGRDADDELLEEVRELREQQQELRNQIASGAAPGDIAADPEAVADELRDTDGDSEGDATDEQRDANDVDTLTDEWTTEV